MAPRLAPARAHPRIGRYAILGRMGRGGMGTVYRALDETLEREVALKTLNAEGSLDAESRRRFEVEAKAAGRLSHPNIVTVYERGEDRGVPFIAMEMLPGVDLEALMRQGPPLAAAEKLDVMAQVLRGLAYAHEHGIVHRDVKPGNVRLLADGTAKIMDFGIAKLEKTHLTRTGMMVGTIHYMSPEQVRGRPLDGRSDVFSAGVILYEMLSGQRPFRGEGPTQVLYRIVNDEPQPLDAAALAPAGDRLRALVARSLAKDPEARFPGALAMADELSALVDELAGPGGRDARAALRSAVAARMAASSGTPDVDDGFPELEATFAATPTREAPGRLARTGPTLPAIAPTEVAATVVGELATEHVPSVEVAALAPTVPAAHSWRWAWAVLFAVVAAGSFALFHGSRPVAPAEARLPVPPPAATAPPPHESRPPAGATVTVDHEHEAATAPVEVLAPAGTVLVRSSYPLDVSWRGRALARGQSSPRLSLPGGRQVLALSAPAVFLRTEVPVVVPSRAEVVVDAPALGRLNVRATPDNCQILVGGAFVDYPPILDRPAAAGRLVVGFRWPDGARRDETVDVKPGAPAFVFGRKE